MMRYLAVLLVACSSGTDDDDTGVDNTPPPVSASIQLLDVQGGALPDAITVTSELESITLDASASGTLQVPADAQFYLEVQADNFITHQLTGQAGQEDVGLVSFFASEATGTLMYNLLGLEQQDEHGILIVAIDNPDLSPAVGASASIDADHDGAFITSSFGVEFSNVVGNGGFVAFPNVAVGDATIDVTPPDGKTCAFHAAGGDGATVRVWANQATVAFFICE